MPDGESPDAPDPMALLSRAVPESKAIPINRARRAFAGGLTQVPAQGVSLLRGIIAVPILLSYLGQARYGLWLTIAETFTVLPFADLGLGGGLNTLLSQATGRKDRPSERQLVSSAFYVLLLLATVFILLDVTVLRTLPLHRFFNVDYAGAKGDAVVMATLMAAMLALALPTTLNQRVYLAYQEAYWTSGWTVVSGLTGLVLMLAAVWLDAGVGWLVLAVFGTPFLVNMVASGVLFFVQKPWLLPIPSQVRLRQFKLLLGLGTGFLVLELLKVVYNHADNLIITYRCGVGEVVPYAVPFRMFLLATTAFQAAVIPLWGAFGEAKGNNDWNWIKRAIRRLLVFTVVGVGGLCTLLALAGPWIVRVWTGGKVEASYGFLFILAALAVSNSVSNSLQICLNGLGLVKQQVPFFAVTLVAKLGLAWVLAPRWGAMGVAVASLVAVSLANVPGFACVLYVGLKRRR
jgi:O-antigen/teichoic acid export membrane protein